MSRLKQEVYRVLDALGDDERTVAETLVAKGIELRCDDPNDAAMTCPIARYLGREFPNVTMLVEGDGSVFTRDGVVGAPRPVATFIGRFDILRTGGVADIDGTVSPDRFRVKED